MLGEGLHYNNTKKFCLVKYLMSEAKKEFAFLQEFFKKMAEAFIKLKICKAFEWICEFLKCVFSLA